jgi:hypothetical protein
MKRYASSLFLSFGVLAGLASADTVTFATLKFTSPVAVSSSGNSVMLTNASVGNGYTVSAEFCENSFCSSPISSSADSLLRFTNFTLSCASGGSACGPISIAFEADGASASNFSSALVAVNFTLTGTATETVTGSSALCFESFSYICSTDGTGTQSFSTAFAMGPGGPLGTPGSSGTATIGPGFGVLGQITINNLDPGNSLSMPGSLDFGMTMGQSTAALPEPSTLPLAAAGFAVLGFAIRKRNIPRQSAEFSRKR